MSFVLLGILNAQAAGAAGAVSDYDLIQSEILPSADASIVFDLTGLSSTYQHLQLRGTYRSNRSAGTGGAGLRFNSDSGTNYTRHVLYGKGGSVTSDSTASTDLTDFGEYLAATATSNSFASTIVDILDPFETTKYTTVRSFNGYAASNYNIALNSGVWLNTAALTQIEVYDRFSTFVTGSRFSLYGLRSVAT